MRITRRWGAFKIRGGLVYFEALKRTRPEVRGVVGATRGNHGQSMGFAARIFDLPATVIVPRGNSPEKNAAMRALGVQLIVEGADFQEACEFADALANDRGLHRVPSMAKDLVCGVWGPMRSSFCAGHPHWTWCMCRLGWAAGFAG